MIRCISLSAIFFLLASAIAIGKDQPAQVIEWPSSSNSIVRITFGRFKEIGGIGHEHSYMTDTTAENLWDKKIGEMSFTLHIFDKNKVRIGDGYISLEDIAPKQSIKFSTTLELAGKPEYIELVPQRLPEELRPLAPPKMVGITVNSVPQGAVLKVDGKEVGTTPKMVQVAVGKHLLEFSKDGFNNGRFPLEIGADDVSGGSVSFELGTSAHDTVELRDGSVLSCDVESVSGMEIVVRVGGAVQHLDRNQVKQVMFVERDAVPASASLPAAK